MELDKGFFYKLCRELAALIMEVYERGTEGMEIEKKKDDSPLTLADRLAHEHICTSLRNEFPDIPILSEESESKDYQKRASWQRFWLVDPLDGTKEFISRNGEFTINIALIEAGNPVAGVVCAPVLNKIYFCPCIEQGAFLLEEKGGEILAKKLTPSTDNFLDKRSLRVIASRSHKSPATQKFIDILENLGKEVEIISSGSSLKLCLVAEGKADVYPRLAPTMEWDTAAGHAIAKGAGKKTVVWQQDHAKSEQKDLRKLEDEYLDKIKNLTNAPELKYNKENLLNPQFVVF